MPPLRPELRDCHLGSLLDVLEALERSVRPPSAQGGRPGHLVWRLTLEPEEVFLSVPALTRIPLTFMPTLPGQAHWWLQVPAQTRGADRCKRSRSSHTAVLLLSHLSKRTASS